jgi:hypothetical protein
MRVAMDVSGSVSAFLAARRMYAPFAGRRSRRLRQRGRQAAQHSGRLTRSYQIGCCLAETTVQDTIAVMEPAASRRGAGGRAGVGGARQTTAISELRQAAKGPPKFCSGLVP